MMKFTVALTTLFVAQQGQAQQAGMLEPEQAPTITLKECTLEQGCTSSTKKVTLVSFIVIV